MVYFKRVVVKNLRTGEEIECPSRYPGIYIMKASEGDPIKVILDIGGNVRDTAGLRIYAFGKRYSEALAGRSHIEKVFVAHDLPGTISILVGHYWPTPDGVLHVDDQRDIEFRPAPKPMPILHLNIPSHWEPSCSKFPCPISFTGKVYDATGQHKYANCNITATIKDLDTGELSTVQTTTDVNGNFRITFNVRKPGKKKIEVVAHTPDGRAEAEAIVNVTGPKFEIVQISADKTTITEGETVNVKVMVKNTGNVEGTANVKLYVDGSMKAQKSVSIRTGSSICITFRVSGLPVGTHKICADVG